MERFVIAVDVGGTNLRAALVNERGHIVKRKRVLSLAGDGIEPLIGNLVEVIEEIGSGEDIAGVGLGIAGIIDSPSGVLAEAPNIVGVNGYPLRKRLNNELSVNNAIVIENDANCAAVGEWWMGAGRGVNSLVMITLGTGVGGGIILGARLWSGANGMGGEIGHMTVYPGGAKCNCGNIGCLESYASATAIRRMIREALDAGTDTALRDMIEGEPDEKIPELLSQAAEMGDECAVAIWRGVGEALGIAVGSLVNVLNIERVIIGGGVSNGWEHFNNIMQDEISRRGLHAPMSKVKIIKSELVDDAGIFGAAYLAFHHGEMN